jgi:hypothetical protein
MEQQGFTYVPHAPAESPTPSSPSIRGQHPALVAYEDLKTFRQKYGFGVYAADVYPEDPNVAPRRPTTTPNPNDAIKASLAPAAKEAYNKALYGGGKGDGGCVNDSMKAVFGDTPADDAAKQAQTRQTQSAFESDPGVVKAANAYAACLTDRGHKLSSTKPRGPLDGVWCRGLRGGKSPVVRVPVGHREQAKHGEGVRQAEIDQWQHTNVDDWVAVDTDGRASVNGVRAAGNFDRDA